MKIVPKDRNEIILKEYHSKLPSPCSFNHAYSRFKERYYWSTMKNFIINCIKTFILK